ncbi:hypothetical protein AST13_06495 [Staphylococcus xylosus]|uniref:hypothetical protein n=1 Tax=Staphylococcus xylosus TaxID=1288 RepID=UPI00085355A2|nr:hypothetical protein [Staphylococcus xylosus]OEL05897.1 hypothetical protein AST13_06495 [Staphylococcus xylosus]
MKRILFVSLISFLILTACGNDKNSESKQKQDNSNLSAEEQEKKYKKETKKLGSLLEGMGSGVTDESEIEESDSDINDEDIKEVQNAIQDFEKNTKGLNQANKEIGNYALKSAKAMLAYVERIQELEEFKSNNPDSEKSYDLALTDATFSLFSTFETIKMDYEDLDINYKKDYLGSKGNEGLTDLLAITADTDLMELGDGMGSLIIEHDEDLDSKQTKELSNKGYREKVFKSMVTEEPDMSKKEYNTLVNDFNDLSPEFLHYEEANRMVSTTEYNYFMDLRNGVVGAETDSEIDDTDFSSESDSSEESSDDSSSEENVSRNNVIDYVEEYEGEPIDTEIYTYKEPEKTEDGEWGFSFTDKDGELAGSYIIDENGKVTKYDENGEEK